MVDYAVHFVMNVCVLERKDRSRARRWDLVLWLRAAPPSAKQCGRREAECVRAGLILLTFLYTASLLLSSNIIRCSSDRIDTLLSTSVAEEQV